MGVFSINAAALQYNNFTSNTQVRRRNSCKLCYKLISLEIIAELSGNFFPTNATIRYRGHSLRCVEIEVNKIGEVNQIGKKNDKVVC